MRRLRWSDGLLVVGLVLVTVGLAVGWSGKFEKPTDLEVVKSGVVKAVPTMGVVKGEMTVETKISLNRAKVEELDKLPGIGPVLAGRIIEYRDKNGGFIKIDELKLVKGIGDKMFEKIRDRISL